MTGSGDQAEVLYKTLDPDDTDNTPTEIESMCPSCEENGITKILLIRIPFYKEVIVMSFACDQCGYRNNEIQSGGKVMEKGARLTVKITTAQDLNRQVIKSEYAAVRIPEIDLEIPHRSQPGGPFTLIVDDPSGNSFIENPHPQQIDSAQTVVRYGRTLDQEKILGLVADDVEEIDTTMDASSGHHHGNDTVEELKNEVVHFGTPCPGCAVDIQTKMKIIEIPHFKECILMSTNCEHCGYKSTEVKSAKGISDKACRLTLTIADNDDLQRDVIKSETCALSIPELDMEGGMNVMVGKFTTVEGLLNDMKHQLSSENNFLWGDSADPERQHDMKIFLDKLDDVINIKMAPVHLILDDSAGNSYIQRMPTQNGDDPHLIAEYYERTPEQNDDLGLTHMKTENYETNASGTS